MDPVKVPATLEKASTLKDGSIRMTFDTQELDREKAATLFEMRNNIGWLIFAPNETREVELPTEPAPVFKNDKSPSQRLRAVLFIEWKQKGEPHTFEIFYQHRVEQYINTIKERLEPIAS